MAASPPGLPAAFYGLPPIRPEQPLPDARGFLLPVFRRFPGRKELVDLSSYPASALVLLCAFMPNKPVIEIDIVMERNECDRRRFCKDLP